MIALVIVIIGIHRTGRCKSLALSPAASTENLAREILGIYICEPGTHHKGLLGSFPSVGQRAVAHASFGGDLGQRNAFQPVAADQLGLAQGKDAGGQHEVGVPQGSAGASPPAPRSRRREAWPALA